jgi:hypothetical protein
MYDGIAADPVEAPLILPAEMGGVIEYVSSMLFMLAYGMLFTSFFELGSTRVSWSDSTRTEMSVSRPRGLSVSTSLRPPNCFGYVVVCARDGAAARPMIHAATIPEMTSLFVIVSSVGQKGPVVAFVDGGRTISQFD